MRSMLDETSAKKTFFKCQCDESFHRLCDRILSVFLKVDMISKILLQVLILCH